MPSTAVLRFTAAGERLALVIEDAVSFAEAVFRVTEKTLKPFDERVGADPTDRFIRADIDAMNRVMSTRTNADALLARAERTTDRLGLLDPAWSMTTMSEAEWNRHRVVVKVAAAIGAFGATWPNVAVVSKLLYLKRPELVPIIDSYVIDHLGPVGSARGAIRRLRENCVANRDVLLAIQDRLRTQQLERTPLRILETCLWAAHPRSPVALESGAWERVVRSAHGA
jgi:hypothetical protein